MTDSNIPITGATAPDLRLDTEKVTIGGIDVERERVQIAGSASGQIAAVSSGAPSTNTIGMAVRVVPSNSSGELKVTISDTLTVGSHAVTNAGTFAVQVTSISAGDNNIGNIDIASAIPAGTNKIGGVDLDSDATIGSAAPSVGQLVAGSDGTNARALKTDSSGKAQVDITAALPAGTNAIGKLAANDGVDIGDVTINNASGNAAINVQDGGNSLTVDGAVSLVSSTAVIGAVLVAPSAGAGPAMTAYFDADGDNTAQAIKAGAGRIYHLECSNRNAADAYLQLFDASTGNTTVGQTTPVQSYLVPAAGDASHAGAFDREFIVPLSFANAITYACTLTPTGSGDPITGLVLNVGFA